MSKRFIPIELDALSGLRHSLAADDYPTVISTLCAGRGALKLENNATHYGMITKGQATLVYQFGEALCDTKQVELSAGEFFCLPGQVEIYGHSDLSIAQGLVISRLGYKGYPQFGGPLEPQGRLKYIDGCSDTLLICPPVIGEPCLNHLHIPPGTNQTAHTHPSQRIGVIQRGSGYCKTPYDDSPLLNGQYVIQDAVPPLGKYKGERWLITPLREGMGWWIPTGLVHSFHTNEDEFLDVVAWHPDSDFGPEHHNHPMISRTFVNGVPASELPEIQTKAITA